ncbi:glycerol kinase GlpK [Nocardioides sp. WL0053]|uniref:Glycerol kinase n=1 Tax=Nocardioides jiangsuensis TaxID=2866161 RepID=A0ABS7RG39_9ACTN|nr:glycerol kinase GlpK [Nocardioides jiangsuensis]MBY9073999.1 glycerol kinase GlpK [Nocardioides jiangsuensis]
MTDSLVAAIDQGTTSTRCLLFDRAGRMVSMAQTEHRQHYPRPGWVEHDAIEVWRNVQRVVPRALRQSGATPSQVAALGLANQRETTVVWDPRDGTPYARAITWQDTRTSALVAALRRGPHAETFRRVSGLSPAPYFAGPRVRWLLDNVPGLRDRAEEGNALFGTMDSWLVWNLTGGPDGGLHVTDVTNASRTMLMDLRTLTWAPELLATLDIPPAMLPEIRGNADLGTSCRTLLPGVEIGAVLGDQQAALFGQTCFDAGEAKCTYGTGAFLLMNVGQHVVDSAEGLLPTVAYQLPGEVATYAVEGSIAMAGSLVQWLRDSLQMIDSAPEIETLARSVPDNGGCYVVPAFSGLFAPRWRPDARGVIVGLTSYVDKGHVARAVLEATAWQTRDVVDAVNRGSGLGLRRLKVDGGMTSNYLLMQCLADVLDVPVERPMVTETVSLGAAYLAGLAVGFWADLQDLRKNWHLAARWEPEMSAARRAREQVEWGRAVERAYGWSPE